MPRRTKSHQVRASVRSMKASGLLGALTGAHRLAFVGRLGRLLAAPAAVAALRRPGHAGLRRAGGAARLLLPLAALQRDAATGGLRLARQVQLENAIAVV